MNYNKHPTVKVGDQVRVLRTVVFVDDTSHGINDIVLVTEANLAYFQMFLDNRTYELV